MFFSINHSFKENFAWVQKLRLNFKNIYFFNFSRDYDQYSVLTIYTRSIVMTVVGTDGTGDFGGRGHGPSLHRDPQSDVHLNDHQTLLLEVVQPFIGPRYVVCQLEKNIKLSILSLR